MGTVVPLSDATRRPARFPAITALIIAVNVAVFLAELVGGDAFVLKWSAVPANIAAGHHWITMLTAMFLHGGWLHIIGNMVFLWAFGPEIEDAMGPLRFLVFYLVGGCVAMLAQIAVSPASTVPNLGASGAIAAVMGAFLITCPHNRMRSLLVIVIYVHITQIPAALLIVVWFLIQLIHAGPSSTMCKPGEWLIWPTFAASSSEPPPQDFSSGANSSPRRNARHRQRAHFHTQARLSEPVLIT